MTIAEAELIVDPKQIDPDHVVTQSVYIQQSVQASDCMKDIKQRTARPRPSTAVAETH